jgi:lipid A 3-O-deacylase
VRIRHLIAGATLATLSTRSFAQQAPSTSLSLDPVHASLTTPPTPRNQDSFHLPPDPPNSAFRLTLYWENDGGFVKPFEQHDRHYTAGVGASLAWRAPWVDSLLSHVPTIFNEFDPAETRYALGFVGTLTIFTPENLSDSKPISTDRPYAGWTYGGLFFQRANYFAQFPAYESFEIDLGILGPSSLAQNAQEMIHHTFNYQTPLGWNNQINDEPEFSLKYNRTWRLARFGLIQLSENGGLFFDILPDAGLTAGSLQDQLQAGTLFRLNLLGDRSIDDFGPGWLDKPADFTFSRANHPITSLDDFLRSQSLSIFARPYARFVAHNALLQGDNWRHDDPVTQNPRPAVAGAEYGIVYRCLNHLEITYLQTWESQEFPGQHHGDSWASLQLSFTNSW